MRKEKIICATLVPFMWSIAPVLGAEVGVGAEEGDDDDKSKVCFKDLMSF